jgi:hypothetical protein
MVVAVRLTGEVVGDAGEGMSRVDVSIHRDGVHGEEASACRESAGRKLEEKVSRTFNAGRKLAGERLKLFVNPTANAVSKASALGDDRAGGPWSFVDFNKQVEGRVRSI